MRRILFGLTLLLVGAATLPAQSPPAPPAAAPRDPNAFFFVQLSDPQFGMFTADGDFAQETANFEFAVAAINRLKPSFVMITGDLTNKAGDPAQIAEYERIRARVAPGIAIHDMPGNHDLGNVPTPASVAAYRARRGPDHYVFQYKTLTGIVLDSTVIHTPDNVPQLLAEQDAWLRAELARARTSNARHIVVFQHHPWFLQTADEADGYFNIPRVRRDPLLTLFRESGVRLLVSGHYHQNAVATAGEIEAVTTAPVGKPLGTARSGLRAFLVTDRAITHRYFEFGNLPTKIDPSTGTLDDAQVNPPASPTPAAAGTR